MLNKRIQLTLFVNPAASVEIEKVRMRFNPVQYRLIRSHVTLCREDELNNFSSVLQVPENLKHPSITIGFAPAARFYDGKGVLMPATSGIEQFYLLRKFILQSNNEPARLHAPHITLMHPRNSTCTGEIFEEIKKFGLPAHLTFTTISLVEQEDGREWKLLKTCMLSG